jgi:hypothetical protein
MNVCESKVEFLGGIPLLDGLSYNKNAHALIGISPIEVICGQEFLTLTSYHVFTTLV